MDIQQLINVLRESDRKMISEKTGIPYDRMAKWLAGKGNPKKTDFDTLLEYFNGTISISRIDKPKKETKVENQGIPYYDIPASAGVVSLFSNSNKNVPSGHIVIPNMPKCDGAIPVSGDSMYPLVKHGDTVLYKTLNNKESILWGGMYVVMIVHDGDEIFFVKYVQRSEREGYVRFVSYNDHHQPVEFPMDSIKAIAEVKATIRINSTI